MPYVVVKGKTWYGKQSQGTLDSEPHPNMTALVETWTDVDSQVSFNKDVWDVFIVVPDMSYYNRPRVRFLRRVSTGVLDEATSSFTTTKYKVVGHKDSVIAEDERELLVDGGNLFIQEEPKRNTYIHVINDGRVHIAQNGHCMIRLSQGVVFANEECQVTIDAYGTSTVNASSGMCRLHEDSDCKVDGFARVITYESNLVVASGHATVIANPGATVHASGNSVVDTSGTTFSVISGNAVLRINGDTEFSEATSEDVRHETGVAIVFIKDKATVITQDGTRYSSTGISYAPSVKMITTGDVLKSMSDLKPHAHPRGNPAFKKSSKPTVDTTELSVTADTKEDTRQLT
jgi:hypothetical protein